MCILLQGRKLLTLPTTSGLTPLMFAVINGQTSIVEEYFNNRNSKKDIYFHKVVKDNKQNIKEIKGGNFLRWYGTQSRPFYFFSSSTVLASAQRLCSRGKTWARRWGRVKDQLDIKLSQKLDRW